MKVAVQGYHAGKAWLCICVGVEPPFSKSWIRHWYCILYTIFSDVYHQLFCHTAAAASVARHIHWRPAAAGVGGAVWR